MVTSQPDRVVPAVQRHAQAISYRAHPPAFEFTFYDPSKYRFSRRQAQGNSALTPPPALNQHGQELSTSDEAPLGHHDDRKATFALHGNVNAAANYGSNEFPAHKYRPNDHVTHSHVTWDRANATAQTEDPFLEARPPLGFEFKSDFGQLANQESPVAGLRSVSLHRRPHVRPPPGLGFTPRSRPTQITKKPPPGLGFTPRSRPTQSTKRPPPGFGFTPRSIRPETSAQHSEITCIEKLRQCQCQCCPNGRHRPRPGFVPSQKDVSQKVQRAHTPLESDFHKWIIWKASKSSNTDSLRPPTKPSPATPEERRLARKAGQEAMRREMNVEDDEAIEAHRQSLPVPVRCLGLSGAWR